MLPCRAPDHHDKAVALDQCTSPGSIFSALGKNQPCAANHSLASFDAAACRNLKFTRIGTTCAKQAWQIALPKAEACY
jgi:hypothetical protein